MDNYFLLASNPPSLLGVLIAIMIMIGLPITALSLLIASVVLIGQKQRKASIICAVLALLLIVPPVLFLMY